MKRYTIVDKLYVCRMENCNMENYLRTFDVNTDIVDFCEDCPFMEAINKLAEYEDAREVL